MGLPQRMPGEDGHRNKPAVNFHNDQNTLIQMDRDIKGAARFTIRDLFNVTALAGLVFSLTSILIDPEKVAGHLYEYELHSAMALICFIGIVAFPVCILVIGFFVLRKSASPFKLVYATLVIVLAILSGPAAYVVARACAYAMV